MSQNFHSTNSSLLQPGNLPLTRELLASAFRSLLVATWVVLLIWYLLANMFTALGDVVQVTGVVALAGGSTLLAWALANRSFVEARLIWLVGLGAAIFLAQAFFQIPGVIDFIIILPLLAVAVSLRWQWGVGAWAVTMALLLVSGRLPGSELALLPLLSGVLLVVGYALAKELLGIAGWSLGNYRSARAELDQLRNERVGFLQVQHDFIQANGELARMADRLAAMQQVAEEARRIKEDFVARVSHELRTPLNMVIGFSEVIMNAPQLYGDRIPSALLADVDSILRNSTHLSRLVDDILDLSQVEAGHMALTKEWTDLSEIIGQAVNAVKGLFDSKGLDFLQEVPPDLPRVFCDGTRICQVIINLLGNAARFTEQGWVKLRLTAGETGDAAGAEEPLAFVTISVQDTGAGIAPTDQARVFEPFQQAGTSLLRHKGGTGLGLTISKQFVEMHGGKMWLESQLGAGTTIYFTLPLHPAVDGSATAGITRWINPYKEFEQRSQPANLPVDEARPRYVLWEREGQLQRYMARYANNAEVIGMRRVEDAVKEVRRSPAQALLLNTPESPDDPQLQQQLGRLPFGTPVISCWLPGKEEAARLLGVVEYLIKPVNRKVLLTALGRFPQARRVLLVDDEPEILRLFVRMLSTIEQPGEPQDSPLGTPYTILQVMNGHRALQLMRSRKPDVILLDLIMPEMNGYQVLQEKSADPSIRDIPVIVVSSRNPNGEANLTRTLSVTRGDGLSIHELIRCIQSLTEILVPEEKTAGREPVKTPGETQAS